MSDDIPSEQKPHIVYPAGRSCGLVTMFETYKLAHDFWVLKHNALKSPYKIATLGRECTAADPVIDVNE